MVFFCDLSQLPDKTIQAKFDLVPVVDKMEADYEVSGYNTLTTNRIYT